MKEYSYHLINQLKVVEVTKNEFNEITENHWSMNDMKKNRKLKVFEDSFKRTKMWTKENHPELLL